MKNILKLGAIAALSLFLMVPAFANKNCKPCKTECKTGCEPRKCELPGPKMTRVKHMTTCQGTPEYRWICKKEYIPCDDQASVSEICVKEVCKGVVVENEGGEAPMRHRARR